jgi:hypothetical protein
MSESGMRFIEPPQPDDRVVAVEMKGEMTGEDMKAMVERFQAVLDRGEKALLFIDMTGYEGFELGVIGEKFKNIGMLWNALDKYAVVGDKRWMEAWIKIIDPLTSPQIKHFQPEETEAAWAWLLASESVGST